MKRISLILALVLLLCGCVQTPPPATTAPPQTTEPIATTLPVEMTLPVETTEPVVITEFSEYEALLSVDGEERNWFYHALGCLFDSPAEIDPYYLFYLGVSHPGSWNDISDASRQSLIDHGLIEEFDLQIMPVDKLEAALQSTFGIGLADVTIPESWGYIEAEDAYCSNHSDAFFPGPVTITAVEDTGETITIHYTLYGYWIPAEDEFLDTASLVLTLTRSDEGTIHAVSNQLES